jgi:SNF2 family DNA or RNA helicase
MKMIQISHQTLSVVVQSRPDIAALFPHGIRVTYQGEDLIAIPHGIDETQLLRNLGLPVPAPIVEHYPFPSADGKRPFGKQVLTAAGMIMHTSFYVLNGMGTGKTKAAIWAFDYLKSVGRAHKMLVVAPLSTLDFTWAREIFNTCPHLKVRVLTGDAKRRHRLLAEKDVDVFIVNHDGVKVIHKELMLRGDIDVICFDEAAAYRNARADRSKLARMLARRRKYIWAMTGSPTPAAPTDAFGLAHLVTPETAPRSFVQFRQDTMILVSQFRWVPRKDAHEEVAKLLQPAVRYTLDEIVELPPVIVREIDVPVGVRQRKVYDALRDHASALLKEGTITAANGGVVFTKMLQASIGWVYSDDDRKIIPLDNQTRITALLDIIASADRKVIVFSPFKSATSGISEALKKEKIEFAEVTGDTPHKQRSEIFTAFQGTDKYKVLNAHPECMAHGLTLTAADTIVWFGPVTKLETYEQANARITRVGQAHKQQIIKLVGTPAERMVYRRLEAKHELQENILDLLAELAGKGEDGC